MRAQPESASARGHVLRALCPSPLVRAQSNVNYPLFARGMSVVGYVSVLSILVKFGSFSAHFTLFLCNTWGIVAPIVLFSIFVLEI